jgi:hypothetical protein
MIYIQMIAAVEKNSCFVDRHTPGQNDVTGGMTLGRPVVSV